MTKPTPPRLATNQVVEIDAMDVMEWQHGQRTPQASDANLAALVKQSAKVHETAPVSAEPRAPSLVPRARPSEARPGGARPATRATGTGARKPEPGGQSARPSEAARPSESRPATRATGTGARKPEPGGQSARPSAQRPSGTVRPNTSMPATRPLKRPESESPFPAIGTPAPSAPDRPALPMSVGGYPISAIVREPAGEAPPPVMQPAPISPSGLPALYVPDRSYTPAVPSPVVKPPQAEGHPAAPARSRRVWWLAGAGGIAAAVLGVALAMTTEDPQPAMPAQATIAPAPVATNVATPTPTPAPGAPAAPTHATESKPSVAAIIARPADPIPAASPPPHVPAPARVAAAIPAPSRPAPARATHPARRARKLVVDYQTHADETAVPGLVAQDSEDPAVARARTAYLAGNDKLFAGDPSGAAAAYREALGLYPGYVGGYRGLGLAYAQLGQTKQAIDALKSYVAAAPAAKDVALIKQRITRLKSK